MRCFAALALILFAFAPLGAQAEGGVSVLVLGVYHMDNPGRDIHNIHADDVLAPKRQAEIAQIVESLARYRPTTVDIEWPADWVAQRYDSYIKGSLPPSPSERVQLGFRLAKATGANIHGVNVLGDFPYDAVLTYAKAHGGADLMADADARVAQLVQKEQALLDSGTIPGLLRYINEPATARVLDLVYGDMLKVGGGPEQPGADLLTAWNKRNFYICANIVQLAKPGDRIVVIYGAGHVTLLRRCLGDVSGYTLANPNDYLPK